MDANPRLEAQKKIPTLTETGTAADLTATIGPPRRLAILDRFKIFFLLTNPATRVDSYIEPRIIYFIRLSAGFLPAFRSPFSLHNRPLSVSFKRLAVLRYHGPFPELLSQ